MAIAEPRAPVSVSGLRNHNTVTTMTATRLMVLATACVTGCTLERARNAHSLYLSPGAGAGHVTQSVMDGKKCERARVSPMGERLAIWRARGEGGGREAHV